MRISSTVFFAAFIIFASCGNINAQGGKKRKKEKTKFVLLETNFGEIKLKLYNETPLHRDNFIKLVEEGFYDSLLFHRVINEFMIQGGDPLSKNAPSNVTLGNGGPGYKIDAEFVPSLYHKKGALAAAREGDQVNPQKKSSGSQFYIVQGKVFNADQLKQIEAKINRPIMKNLIFRYLDDPKNLEIKQEIEMLQKSNNFQALNKRYSEITLLLEPELMKEGGFLYAPEQIKTYTTIGGTPHLDQNYTVFGEVVEGLNVVDSIATVKTGKSNRPISDVWMKMKVVEE